MNMGRRHEMVFNHDDILGQIHNDDDDDDDGGTKNMCYKSCYIKI